MSSVDFEDKTVEDAIARACEKLGLPRDQVEVEILSKGSTGIFGIVGAKKAKIRVTSKAPAIAPAADRAREILAEMLKHIDLPTETQSETRDEHVYLNITSNGSGLLIGKRGKTLNALQYLVTKILQKEISENVAVTVDTENYRSKRETNLVELAQQLGDKVKKSHRPLTTGPMSSHDRRVIHLALKEDTEIRTKSKGEGNLRRVVIYPVKRAKREEKVEETAE